MPKAAHGGSVSLQHATHAVNPHLAVTRRTSLHLRANLPVEEWKRIGLRIGAISESSVWWLGDWLVYGQRTYPDRYQQAIKDTELDYQTLRNYAWVAGRFPAGRRRHALSFQHHAEVASLPPGDQDRWLDKAERLKWSRNQLRGSLREARAVGGGTSRAPAVRVSVNIPPDQAHTWQEAAKRARQELPEWIASVLTEAARRNIAPELPQHAATTEAARRNIAPELPQHAATTEAAQRSDRAGDDLEARR
jgi:hypothetical protein